MGKDTLRCPSNICRAPDRKPGPVQYMGVDHSGGDIHMPQKLLHRADVVACFKQMGGPARRGINSGVAQSMTTYFLADTGPHKRLPLHGPTTPLRRRRLRPFDIKRRTVRPYPVLLQAGLEGIPKSLNCRRLVLNFVRHKTPKLQSFMVL